MIAAKVRVLNTPSLRKLERTTGVSNEYIAHAAIVLEYAPELTDSVIAGKRSQSDVLPLSAIFSCCFQML